ncbi:MAG: AAA family ATPase [Oscillospiraceae bacterium]
MERRRTPKTPYFAGRKTGRKDLFRSGVWAHPCYENVAYFNFETNPKLNETFEENISPDYLIPILSHIAGQTIVKEKTLIVFDEVQLCERALTSLKYFCEDAPDYHIIALGSLLGVAVNRAKFSFPVGKVDMKTLYPMDMEEFMLALGEDDLTEQIKKCFHTDTPLPSALHDAAMQLYRQYLVVGGMPECVMQFAKPRIISLSAIRRIRYLQAISMI